LSELPPLPDLAEGLCSALAATPQLVRHLQIVHASALMLTDGLRQRFPDLAFDREAVLTGAAIHDLGKVLHPNEIDGPGRLHERDGPSFLQAQGLEPKVARFARTHAEWEGEAIEDLLVAFADTVWKGQRLDALEQAFCRVIAAKVGISDWEAWSAVDELACEICLKLSGWI